MGGAASSTAGGASPVKGPNSLESQPSFRNVNNAPSSKKTLKVPLHIALRAIVIIQKRVRMRIAYRRLKRLAAIKAAEDAAALKYLNGLREQMENAKLSPVKQTRNKFAQTVSIFNNHEYLETVGGDGITVDDYFDANKLSSNSLLIYPSLGFVIKSKTMDIGRKVFINITHHELVPATNNANMKFTQPRLLLTTSTTEEGNLEMVFENILVFDVLISSAEYNEHFVYKQGMGVVPVSAKIKNKYSELVIHFLNSFEHSYNNSHPSYHSNSSNNTKINTFNNSSPVMGSNNRRSKKNTAKGSALPNSLVDDTVSDFKISLSYKFPKIKRCYVGEVTPMVFHQDSSIMTPVYYKHNSDKLLGKSGAGVSGGSGGGGGGVNSAGGGMHDLTNQSTQQLCPPPLLRQWLVLPTERQQQLLLAASSNNNTLQFTREVTQINDLMYDNDVQDDPYTSMVGGAGGGGTGGGQHRKDTPFFNTTENRRVDAPSANRSSNNSEDGKQGDLEDSHVRYFKRLNDLLTGVVSYVVVNHGVLTLYYHSNVNPKNARSGDSSKNDPKNNNHESSSGSAGLLNPSPYGYQEYTRVLLFNYHIAISIDNVNHIFYLQLLSNPPSPLDTYSMLFNQYDSVNDEVILQFKTYSELLAWKLYLTSHMEYSNRVLRLVQQFNKQTTINSFPAWGIPQQFSTWTTRVRSGSGNNVLGGLNYISTTRVFIVIAMGLLKIYSDDKATEAGLLEVMSLQQVTVLVRKGAMVNRANRTCDVLVSLMRDHYLDQECVTDIIAEFIYYAAPPDDPAVTGSVDSLYKHIHFATHHAYSYMIPFLEYNHKVSLDEKDLKLTSVTMTTARLTDTPLGQREEEQEEDEPNSDDDVTVLPPSAMKKPFGGKKEPVVREEVFRCIATTKDYKSRTDLNKFTTPLTPSLHSRTNTADITYDLILCDDKLLIYQHFCFVASLNISINNVELVTPPQDSSSKTADKRRLLARPGSGVGAAAGSLVPNSQQMYSISGKNESKSGGDDVAVPEVVYDAWQITIVASNSLKYRIRFPTETQYLDWLRVIDKNCECVEHKVVVAPAAAAPGEEQEGKQGDREGDTMQLSDDDEDELTMLRERNGTVLKEDAVSSPTKTGESPAKAVANSLALFQSKQNIRGNNPADSIERNIDNNATKKFFRLLREGEKVIASGMVQKWEPKPKGAFAAPSSKRIVVLTTTPRILFLDPIGNIVRGHIELPPQVGATIGNKVEYRHSSLMDWEISVGGMTTKLTVCDEKDAKFWTHKLKVAVR